MWSLPTIKKKNKQSNKEVVALEKKKREASVTLKELNIETDPIDILDLLQNRKRLDEVLRRLKLKAFW